jgi:preprotein translocase subunit SecG
MGFLIGLFTVVMVLDCLILVFLVLLQLPKKEAGAGLAFGGAATDALFGAGSGTVLTKITRYAATTFFVLAVGLSIMQSQYHSRRTSAFEDSLRNPSRSAAPVPAPTTPPSTPAATPSSTNVPLISTPPAESTNLPAPSANTPSPSATTATGTNPAAPPK